MDSDILTFRSFFLFHFSKQANVPLWAVLPSWIHICSFLFYALAHSSAFLARSSNFDLCCIIATSYQDSYIEDTITYERSIIEENAVLILVQCPEVIGNYFMSNVPFRAVAIDRRREIQPNPRTCMPRI